MDRKVKSDFATAYKLSRSVQDNKARLKRRSVEQRQGRYDEMSKKRNLKDLSPLQESDCTLMKDKHYHGKTPTKTNGKKGGENRLEQLKKWKEERSKRREQESIQKKPVFRVSRAVNHETDSELFKKSKLKKHPVKPTPVPVLEPPAKVEPSAAKSRHTTRTVEKAPSAVSRQTTRTRQPMPPPSKHQPMIAPKQTTRVTRQATKKIVSARGDKKQSSTAKSNNKENIKSLTNKVTTKRGTGFPVQESFDASSFIFNPMSPRSTANFLCAGQNNSCSSFWETTPNRISTPKRDKDQTFRSQDASRQEDSLGQDNTMVSEEDSVISRKPEPVRRSSRLSSRTSTSASLSDNESVEKPSVSTIGNDTSMRRNKRRSVHSTTESIPEEPSKEQEVKISTVKEIVSSTLNSSLVTVSKSADASIVPAASSKATPRRSLRRSILSTRSTEEESNSEDEPPKSTPKGRRKSVTISEPVSASPFRTNRRRSVNVDVDQQVAPGSAKRRQSTRGSLSSADVTEVVTTPTPSSRRMSRRSVAVLPETEPIVEAEMESDVPAEQTVRQTRRSITMSPSSSSTIKAAAESTNVPSETANLVAVTQTYAQKKDSVDQRSQGETSDSNDEVFAETARIAEPKSSARTPRNQRNKSFGGFRLPSADSAVLSGKRSAKRKSMLPKSPEEWVELLKNSPMVEMTRRRRKSRAPVETLNFDDAEIEEVLGTSMSELRGTSIAMETDVGQMGDSAEVKDIVMETNTTKLEDITMTTVQVGEVSSTQDGPSSDENGPEEFDVPYFRDLMRSETHRLNALCDQWNHIKSTSRGISDDIQGQIRTTVGQARLLMDQRFKQFSGLVDNCEFKMGEKETTCTDLKGFWDMVYFQVEDVDNKFANLTKLSENNWVDDKPKPVTKKIKKKVTKPSVTKPAVKSKFAAFRAQMKKQQDEIISKSPAVALKEEEKTFEMPGFFKVTSPVRTPKPHCEGGTPKKPTPSSTPTTTSSAEKLVLKDTLTITGSSDVQVRSTPTRKCYLPVVPSPLLQDTTPAPRPTRSCTQKTPRVLDLKAEHSSTPNRSLRTRKSVNFAESLTSAQADSPSSEALNADFARLLQPSEPVNSLADQGSGDDFLRLLQPMEPKAKGQKREAEVEDPFSKYLEPMESEENPPKRRRASLKGCRSTERRRSHSRNVHFTSQAEGDILHMKMPHTPYNKNSLVKQGRVARRSSSSSSQNPVDAEDDIFSIDNIDNEENIPPPTFRSPRPSLLGTPPALSRPSRVNTNVPTATLISFTP